MMYLHPHLVAMENLSRDVAEPLLGVTGQDPRTEASPELGSVIVHGQLQPMKSLLEETVAGLE